MERETVSSTNQNQSKTLDKIISWPRLADITRVYAYYLSGKEYALSEVLEKVPQAITSVLKLMYELEEWGGCKNLLTDDQKYLEGCANKYALMGIILYGIGRGLKNWDSASVTSQQIITLMNDLTTLQNSQTIESLYRLYLETGKVAKQLELSGSYASEIFINMISEYLRGNKLPFLDYVTEAQSDKIEMTAFRLLWKSCNKSC